jgi:hypothetical protein
MVNLFARTIILMDAAVLTFIEDKLCYMLDLGPCSCLPVPKSK